MDKETKQIPEIRFEDFFHNLKSLPAPETPEFNALVDQEIERMMGGVTVDGVFFPGFLYWHLSHWWIRDDAEDDFGNVIRDEFHPSLRDNEWIVTEYLEICRLQKLGYMHIGVRQFGKSDIMASYLAYHAVLFKMTQNVIVGGNDDDLQLLRDKIDFGIKKLWLGIRIPKLDKDTRKNMTRLGFKSKSGEDEVWSYLIIRNVAEGNKTEGPAGITAKAFALDECGKFAFAQAFEAAKPAFKSKYGWRCVPLIFGTGGAFDKGADAERYFWHPDANNLLSVTDPVTGKKSAIFMSGLYRIDCKYETNLRDYLIQEGKIPQGEYPELAKIPIHVSDKEKALALILKEREDKKKDPDQIEYLKLIMYYPLTPEECFLTVGQNLFNVTAAKSQQARIRDEAILPMNVFLTHDGEKIVHEFSDKRPISNFPYKGNEDLDAPIQVWEMPMKDPPYGLYVGGVDSYRDDDISMYSHSLGVVYIMKRTYDLLGEGFQDAIVACYAARPQDKEKWKEQARLLIKWYNARALVENDEISFIDHMKSKGDSTHLEPRPAWEKEFNPNSSSKQPWGLSRKAQRTRNHLNDRTKKYLDNVIIRETDEKGVVTKELLGVTRIFDPVLLQEIITYNSTGNFDRVIAFSLAVTLMYHLDDTRGSVKSATDPRYKSIISGKKNRSLFKASGKLFGNPRPIFKS